MEGTKYLILGIFLGLLPVRQNARDYRWQIYQAYVSGRMDLWKQTMDELAAQKPDSDALVLQLLDYQYGYIPWCLERDKSEEAAHYIQAALKNIGKLEKDHYKVSQVNAYKSAIYAFSLRLHPYKAPFLGPKSLNAVKLSMEQDSTDPYGFLQYGHALYYMPSIFGGSKTKAISYYVKAQHLMEKDTNSLTENWNYLSLLVTLAQAYQTTAQYEKAYRYYKLILNIEPHFLWVKEELFPEFLKKHITYEQ